MGAAFVLKCPGSAALHLLLDTFLKKKKEIRKSHLKNSVNQVTTVFSQVSLRSLTKTLFIPCLIHNFFTLNSNNNSILLPFMSCAHFNRTSRSSGMKRIHNSSQVRRNFTINIYLVGCGWAHSHLRPDAFLQRRWRTHSFYNMIDQQNIVNNSKDKSGYTSLMARWRTGQPSSMFPADHGSPVFHVNQLS